jgi:hypothetical protein
METLLIIVFVFLYLVLFTSFALVCRSNDQLRKDLKNAYQKIKELQK